MDGGPVFVAGIARSGTSLMYALLASHPSIAMTRRTNLWRYFYNRFGDLAKPGNLDRCLSAMMSYKRLRVLNPDPERIRQEFWQGQPTYARLFRLLIEHHLQNSGKPRWGDKSLNAERYIEDIFTVYPTAKIIHMIRDPRDRFASARTRWSQGKGGVAAGTAIWLLSVGWARQNQRRYSEQYKVLCYESLVSRPEEALRGVCAFIGEDYAPQMLSMEGAESFRDAGGNSSYAERHAGHISTRSIGRFREVMSKHEIAFMQTYAGRYMKAYGYPLEPIQLSLGEELRLYAAEWPGNLARMVAWSARETVRDRMGRTPSPHTVISSATTQP